MQQLCRASNATSRLPQCAENLFLCFYTSVSLMPFTIQDCTLGLFKAVKGICLLCLNLCMYVCSAGLNHLC